MIEVGRLCVKTAGREATKRCIVVDVLDKNFVLIDGQVKRKKCNIQHLEPLKEKIKIKKGANHEDIVKEFKKLNIEIKEKKTKEILEKPTKKRKQKLEAPIPQKKKETNKPQVEKKKVSKKKEKPKK